VNRRWGHAVADLGDNALKATKKVYSGWGTIGADRDPTPMPIPLFAARNCRRYFRELSSAPIHTQAAFYSASSLLDDSTPDNREKLLRKVQSASDMFP